MSPAELRREIDRRRREELLLADRCYDAGSRRRYWRGCRCPDCTADATLAKRESRQRDPNWLAKDYAYKRRVRHAA